MCPIDCWGTSEVIELLLQLKNRNGFYSDTLEWISIAGLQICGSLSDTSKQILSPRFLSVARILVIDYPNDEDMTAIISNQFSKVYKKFKDKTTTKVGSIENIVGCLIKTYTEVRFKLFD